MKTVVVGSGAWGTALAIRLYKNGHDVTIWTFEKELIPQMDERLSYLSSDALNNYYKILEYVEQPSNG